MTRSTIIVFLAFHALLSYVDSTSNLPYVPGNVQPFAENSNNAPAKKVLRADKKTMENEERVNPLAMVHEMRQNHVLQKILPQEPQHQLNAIAFSLRHEKMSSAIEIFKNAEDKLLEALRKSYGGLDKVISGLLIFETSGGIPAANAKKLLEMQKQSWKRNDVRFDEAFDKLKLKDEPLDVVIFDTRVTFLEDYIKLIKSTTNHNSVNDALLQVLENGFGDRDKFFKLVTETIQNYGEDYQAKSVNIGGRYIEFLVRLNDRKHANELWGTMVKIHGEGWNDKFKLLINGIGYGARHTVYTGLNTS